LESKGGKGIVAGTGSLRSGRARFNRMSMDRMDRDWHEGGARSTWRRINTRSA